MLYVLAPFQTQGDEPISRVNEFVKVLSLALTPAGSAPPPARSTEGILLEKHASIFYRFCGTLFFFFSITRRKKFPAEVFSATPNYPAARDLEK